jgi:phosphocarrier protein HPr
MITDKLQIINKRGLHARAAAKLVALTSGYRSSVKLSVNGRQVDGKSIMQVMMLAAGKGSEIEIAIDGEDEQSACDALCALINNRFDESE